MEEPRDDSPEASALKDDAGAGPHTKPPVPSRDERLPALVQRLPAKTTSAWTKGRWLRVAMILGIVALAAAIGTYWWTHRQPLLPGIAYGNGRLEADPIDIATKFAGRILELRVDEGDMVTAGQVLAVMDTRDLEASLKKSEAQVEEAQKAVNEANVIGNEQAKGQTEKAGTGDETAIEPGKARAGIGKGKSQSKGNQHHSRDCANPEN